MPDRQPSLLRFPLEESIWFEKGQEVDELISISLDPHITIFEEENYVVLKGTLELSGEYKHCLYENQDHEFSDVSRKYIQTVEMRNEEESEFSHHFPVNITVPRRKVINMDEIYFEIHSFDYVLPQNSHLQLVADIHLHGIYEEAEKLEGLESYEEEVAVPITHEAKEGVTLRSEELIDFLADELEENEESSVSIESSPHNAEESSVQAESSVSLMNEQKESVVRAEEYSESSVQEATFESSVHQDEEIEVKLELVHDEQSSERRKAIDETHEADLYEPFSVEAMFKFAQEEAAKLQKTDAPPSFPNLPELALETLEMLTRGYVPEQRERGDSSHLQDLHEYDAKESSSSQQGISSQYDAYEEESSEKEPTQKQKKKKGKYKSMSFSEFFARKEEESSVKMKVCLVQQGDTIHGLAEKYKLTSQQILRANNLDASHEVYEGQVLYIPVKGSLKLL